MRVVSESDVVERLPALLEEVKREALLIRNSDGVVAVLSSPEEFEEGRRAKAERALTALDTLGKELREGAAVAGISVDELEKMLDRHAV